MIAKLPLVSFEIINFIRFSLLAASRLSHGSRKSSGTRVALKEIG